LYLLLRNLSYLSCCFFPSLRSWYSAWNFMLKFLQQVLVCLSVRVVRHVSNQHKTRKTSHRRAGFDARPVNVEFVAGKVALGQVFLRVLQLSPPVSIIPALLHNNILPINHRQNAVLTNVTASIRTRNIKS
jgi:hypothetical protein